MVGEPVALTRATKEPLNISAQEIAELKRQAELDRMVRIHAELLLKSERSAERCRKHEAHHRAIGQELTNVRLRMAELSQK